MAHQLGEAMRKPRKKPQPKFDFRDRPHDAGDVYDKADVRVLKQKIAQGYTYSEVADWLGRTEAGVRSKIFRLRQRGEW